MKALKLILLSFLMIVITAPAITAEAYVSVKGYYKANGTYVAPYVRSNPNGIKYDNYGYKPSQGLYNQTYGTRGTTWDTPTYITDPNYYEGQELYETGQTDGADSYTSYYGSLDDIYKEISHGYKSYGAIFCDSGYYEKNDKCIKEPDNGYVIGSSIYCDYGYVLNGSKCLLKSATTNYSTYLNGGCPANSSQSLTNSSRCTCNIGYEINKDKNSCIKNSPKENDRLCQSTFGKNSKWSKGYSSDKVPTCSCKNKYEWNKKQTSCIKSE